MRVSVLRRKVLWGFGSFPLLVGCGNLLNTYVLNYRLTVAVSDGEKTYSGSSVYRVHWRDQRGTIAAVGSLFGRTERGQSLVVDLPGGEKLITLLISVSLNPDNYIGQMPERVLGKNPERVRKPDEQPDDFLKSITTLQTKVTLTPEEYPPLVRFRDIDDPYTIEIVDPREFVTPSGKYRVQSVTLETVDEPVTRGIEKTLPWLRTLKGRGAYEANVKIGERRLTEYHFIH